MPKKIAVVVNSRANYARIKSLLIAIQKRSALQLELILGASSLVSRHGNLEAIITKDGLKPTARVHTIVEGDKPSAMATSTGLGVIELASLFENMKPDIVLTVADRFETLATALAASYMNIPVAHTQGGELTGSIDESVRHAVTKLSHYHFPATVKSAERLIVMGENPEKILMTGCPSLDLATEITDWGVSSLAARVPGVGAEINLSDPYLIVLQHPVTTEWETAESQIQCTIDAISSLGIQAFWLWPNVDAGSDTFSAALRRARELGQLPTVHFLKNLPPEDYLVLMKNAKCILGNSSSAIREGAFLSVPAINIGTRQLNRERSNNVVDVGYDSMEIIRALEGLEVLGKGLEPSHLYGDGFAGDRIAEFLSGPTPHYQKEFYEWSRGEG